MTAVPHGLGHVLDAEIGSARQVGNSARDLQDTVEGARGQSQLRHGHLQERRGLRRRDLGDRWAELRAFEIEVDDLAGTLDYPDVLPYLRVPL